MSEPRYQPFERGEPTPHHVGPHLHADGLLVWTGTSNDDTDQPVLALEFTNGPHRYPPILLVGLSDEELDRLVDLIRDAVESFKAKRPIVAPPTTGVCPGCGLRIFGTAAARGACFACFPVARGDELADESS